MNKKGEFNRRMEEMRISLAKADKLEAEIQQMKSEIDRINSEIRDTDSKIRNNLDLKVLKKRLRDLKAQKIEFNAGIDNRKEQRDSLLTDSSKISKEFNDIAREQGDINVKIGPLDYY